ncbi:hypothetical protein AVEN_218451-1 [Araneus ventricosus]|uniref:Mos1 transposase HTH domain-containing protein n=1 Tax=Araneus ventricosus TaxID=182803 RepID=A0A4Y2WCT4_ARAVE|nr:hypothetical protein AVEN_150750-1 [Araneus ventricosus]GBO35069.1 hypothetical protein AVEN_218451-1 [Araneus ventricosus]
MDSSRSAQRAVIQFLRAEGKHASQIYHRIKEVHGGQYLPRCTIFRWCQRFEAGRVNIKDFPRPALAHVVTNSATFLRWMSSCSKGTGHFIIHKMIGYGNVCSQRVPKYL